jgi:hypothetical protein
MSPFRGRDNRDTTKTIRLAGIGVRLNGECENIKPALRTDVQQWILLMVIANIHVGARLKKRSDHLRMMLVGGVNSCPKSSTILANRVLAALVQSGVSAFLPPSDTLFPQESPAR